MTDRILNISRIAVERWKNILMVLILIGATFVLVDCAGYLIREEGRVAEMRAANGGILPGGGEAIDNKGRRYSVRTIEHNGNTYTCFSYDVRGLDTLACAKE